MLPPAALVLLGLMVQRSIHTPVPLAVETLGAMVFFSAKSIYILPCKKGAIF